MADDGMRDSGTNAASPGTSATNPDTNARLAAIRGRLECVGYLPWSATGDGRIEDSEGCVVGGFALRGYSRLAAAAPTDLAYLLGIAEAAWAEVEADPPWGDDPTGLRCMRCVDAIDVPWDDQLQALNDRGEHVSGCSWDALRRAFGGSRDAEPISAPQSQSGPV